MITNSLPKKEFKPSPYQQALFDFISSGRGSAIVEAVAGSGKTTTIVKALDLIPLHRNVCFLAFNKSIADELKSRVPSNVVASTFHSAGFRAWASRNRGVRLDDRKVNKIIYDLFSDHKDLYKKYASYIIKMVSLAKQRGIGCLVPDSVTEWQSLANHFEVDLERVDDYEVDEIEAIHYCSRVLGDSIETSDHVIDYNDMIYMPILADLPLYKYNYVFIDEAQDTNNVRREIASRMLFPDSRLIAVGDTHQAIYGFTGADSDSMQLIQNAFNCKIFPLSISYRCSKSIVTKAKEIVPEIEFNESSPEGSVETVKYKKELFSSNDVILCRNTAPIISLAYDLISDGVGCKVLGTEIGRGLCSLIEKLEPTDIDDLYDKLSQYEQKEVTYFMKKDMEERAQTVRDKVTCIETIARNLKLSNNTIEALMIEINNLFSDQTKGILTLSTVHKAKGLEWDRVFIYKPELMPSRYARQDWQKLQEQNLIYVAITRAKMNLFYIV